MNLYRYINLDKFHNLIRTNELCFVNPFTCWLDEKEGYLYRLAQSKDKLSKIGESIGNGKFKGILLEQLQNGCLYKDNAKKDVLDWFGMRCQSWCYEKNSEKMWKSYIPDGQGVCIEVDSMDIRALEYNGKAPELCKVEYVETLCIKDELKKALSKTGEFYYPLILQSKLKKYSFEKEYRYYFSLADINDDNIDNIRVKINKEIDLFIKTVYFPPNATKDFKNDVMQICDKLNIRFVL